MIEIIPNWHPFLVHFTIALFFTATAFFVAGRLFAGKSWSNGLVAAGRWNLWLGAFLTLGTIAAGFYAYNTVAHDTASHSAMTDHRNWALPTATAFLALALWSLWEFRKRDRPGLIFITILIVASAALGVTGFKGGEAVYRHGLGVMSLPQAEGDGHDHEHAAGEEHDTPPVADGDNSHEHGDDAAPHSHDGDAVPEADHDATPHGHPGNEQASDAHSANDPEAEAVKAVLLAYNKRIDAADIAGIEQYVVASDAFSIIEGGHANWGWADYRDNHLTPELNSPDLEILSYRLSNIKVTTGASLAYTVFDYDFEAVFKGEKRSRHGMGTAVLTKVSGLWKIIHLQTS